ncbi:MAG: bacteriorhodopsin [Ardenticatenaceae bacterium]|nr:bacteriorhodopsin [Ardenticatenaceae bacterium]
MDTLISFENLFSYSPMAYDIVAHTLTLGYAVMLAGLFYFAMTIRSVAPKYRTSSILSVVVMVSAFLILFSQQLSWTNAFEFNATSGMYESVAGEDAFSNGYRYLNWLIDVPMLLFQILFVVTITSERRRSLRNQFFISGPLMIITGYIGQFYETTNMTAFLVWGFISTIFFVHVLYLIYNIIQDAKKDLSPRAGAVMNGIWWLFLVSWMLYPGAYLMPLLLNSEAGVVGRQITYTIADISSKVIYGVMLTYVAQIRSEEEGYSTETESFAAAGD